MKIRGYWKALWEIAGTVLLAIWATPILAQAPIVIPNAGFEQWQDDAPVRWTRTGNQVRLSQGMAPNVKEGMTSLRIETTGSWQGVEQSIPVEPNTLYTLLIWNRVEKGGGLVSFPIIGMADKYTLSDPEPNMRLSVMHFKTIPDMKAIKIGIYSEKSDSIFYVDDLRIIPGRVDIRNLSRDEQDNLARTWVYHSPEFYQELRKEFRDHMVKVKAEFNADKYPEYRTEIVESGKDIQLKRQLYSLSFSKSTCSVTSAVLRGERPRETALPNMDIIAEDGTIYSQENATNGILTVRDSQFNVLLDGEFNPRSKDGKEIGARFGISYNLYKMAGLLTVRYSVKDVPEEAPHIKRITVYNTLGLTKKPLNYYFQEYGFTFTDWPKQYFQRKWYELASDANDMIIPIKDDCYVWTNGAIGLGAYPLRDTAGQMVTDSKPVQRFAYEIQSKKRLISMTFLQNSTASNLDKNFKADFALAVYPIKKVKPTSRIMGTSEPGPQYLNLAQLCGDDPQKAAPAISKYIQNGGTTYGGGGANDFDVFPSNEVPGPYKVTKYLDAIKTWNDIFHRNGAEIMWGSLGYIPWSIYRLEAEGFFTPEEMESVRANGNKGNPLVREFLLTSTYYYLQKLGFDGEYIDLIGDEQEVGVIYNQDMRLLCDSLPGKKFYVFSSYLEVSPQMALADHGNPGEHMMGSKWDIVPMAYLDACYNPMIIGNHTWFYNDRSYNLRKGVIWKQVVRNVLIPQYHFMTDEFRTWGRAGHNDEKEYENFKKYGLPNLIFDIGSANFHHPYDEDYGKYARVSNPNVTVNIFLRAGETMITVSNGVRERDKAVIALNRSALGLGEGGVVVYDTVAKDLIPYQEKDGWLELKSLEITDTPFIIVVKSVKENDVTVLWHDSVVRNWRIVKPIRNEAGFNIVDFEWETLPGTAITAFYCGKLGPPKNLWHPRLSVVDYDHKNQIAYIQTYSPLTDGFLKEVAQFCFGRNDQPDLIIKRTKGSH